MLSGNGAQERYVLRDRKLHHKCNSEDWCPRHLEHIISGEMGVSMQLGFNMELGVSMRLGINIEMVDSGCGLSAKKPTILLRLSV